MLHQDRGAIWILRLSQKILTAEIPNCTPQIPLWRQGKSSAKTARRVLEQTKFGRLVCEFSTKIESFKNFPEKMSNLRGLKAYSYEGIFKVLSLCRSSVCIHGAGRGNRRSRIIGGTKGEYPCSSLLTVQINTTIFGQRETINMMITPPRFMK